jgi:pimeloyl-ACP methyl ester carboxylesterase
LWRRQVEALAPEFDVVAPDLPGFGQTPEPTEPFSFVDTVVPHLPAAVVGNSMGGRVALRTALAHPDKVSKLVLVGAGVGTWDWTETMRDYFGAEEAACEAGDFATATQINLDFWVARPFHDEVRPQLERTFELQSADGGPEVLWPEDRPLSSLEMPTLVVIGELDKPDFHVIAQHLAEGIPDADLVVVPGAGHLVGVEQPEELNALLLEFL